ncbi:MAG: hypothetical protein SFT90_07365 [Rickettsiales bacterium]|nr:hypothetical protein [Rickettsiales bacterium]
MLDFNHRPKFYEDVNALIDTEIQKQRMQSPARNYLGASRLGVACSRALQYEYLNVPKDEEKEFTGDKLRIFELGHNIEQLAINWLKMAGLELYTNKSDGSQFGFSVLGGKIRGHVDGIINSAPASLIAKYNLTFPMLWECKSMNNKYFNETVKKGLVISKPIYAAQIATYQAYMEGTIAGISNNHCWFTAVNKDNSEIYHELIPFNQQLAQNSSDRAVNIIAASEAGETLPKISNDPCYFECKMCSYNKTCWRA